MIAQENWAFVGGGFVEFDGHHHNDSEIYALLKKQT
jgi:hypothetical protein